MNNNMLKDLYTIHSPSKKEDQMLSYLQKTLDSWRIPFEIGPKGQLYSINPGTPLLVAHTDQVQRSKCDKVMQFKNKLFGFDSTGKLTGLGADDKNGIFITLNQIKLFRENVSFIFSTNEEAGGYLRLLMKEIGEELKESTPYGLIFDRKGAKDIIGTSNNYCCEDLELAIQIVGSEFGYKPAHGVFSDCDELSNYIPCVNLSCGYYNAHSVEEYTKIPDLWNANRLAECLIKGLPRKDKPFETPEPFDYLGYNPDRWSNWENWNSKDYSSSTSQTKTSKTKAKTKAEGNDINMDAAYLELDDRYGIHYYDHDGGETFLGYTGEDAVGEWNLDEGELLVDRKFNGHYWEYFAVYTHGVSGKSYDVEISDYREDLETEEKA